MFMLAGAVFFTLFTVFFGACAIVALRTPVVCLLVLLFSGAAQATNVKDYGAKGDGQTDDTAALQAAYDGTATGDTLLIPPGKYNFTKPIAWIGKDVDLSARRAELKWAGGSGTAITVGGKAGQTLGLLRIDGLRISRPANWSEDSTGLVLQNIQYGDIRIEMAGNFRRGIVVRGDGAGCAYNRIQASTHNCQIGMTIETAAGGWCNRNTLYDSSFMVSASAPAGDAVMLLFPDGTYPTGGWSIRDTSFQSGRTCTALRVEQRGQLILDGCWFETVGQEKLWVDVAKGAYGIRCISSVEGRGFTFSDRCFPRVVRNDLGWAIK